MWEETTPERREEIIEKIARAIVKSEMEAPAILFLETMMPMYYVGGNIARMLLGPYLPYPAHDYISVFEDKEAVKKILKRVEDLKREKDELKNEMRERSEELGLIDRLKRLLKM